MGLLIHFGFLRTYCKPWTERCSPPWMNLNWCNTLLSVNCTVSVKPHLSVFTHTYTHAASVLFINVTDYCEGASVPEHNVLFLTFSYLRVLQRHSQLLSVCCVAGHTSWVTSAEFESLINAFMPDVFAQRVCPCLVISFGRDCTSLNPVTSRACVGALAMSNTWTGVPHAASQRLITTLGWCFRYWTVLVVKGMSRWQNAAWPASVWTQSIGVWACAHMRWTDGAKRAP